MAEDATTVRLSYFDYLSLVCGFQDVRERPGGRWSAVMPLMYTHAIVEGRIGDMIGYDDRWCYRSRAAALAAHAAWNGEGEPDGWHRHPGSGRRRGDDPPPWAAGQTEWVQP